jgi:hypothetical protein
MQDVEHYNSVFTYRRDLLQKISDVLFCMSGLREKEESADTERFYFIQDFLATEDEQFEPNSTSSDSGSSDSDSSEATFDSSESKSSVRRVRKVDYYIIVRKYLKALELSSNSDNDLKQKFSKYQLKDDVLYNSELNTFVVITLKDLIIVIELIHKDLSHYDKASILNEVRKRYEVTADL